MRLKVSCLCGYFLHCRTRVRSYRVCYSLTFGVWFLLRPFLNGFHSKENKYSIYLHCFFLQSILKVYPNHSLQLVTNCVELVAHDRFTCPSLVAITFRTSQSAHTPACTSLAASRWAPSQPWASAQRASISFCIHCTTTTTTNKTCLTRWAHLKWQIKNYCAIFNFIFNFHQVAPPFSCLPLPSSPPAFCCYLCDKFPLAANFLAWWILHVMSQRIKKNLLQIFNNFFLSFRFWLFIRFYFVYLFSYLLCCLGQTV